MRQDYKNEDYMTALENIRIMALQALIKFGPSVCISLLACAGLWMIKERSDVRYENEIVALRTEVRLLHGKIDALTLEYRKDTDALQDRILECEMERAALAARIPGATQPRRR